MHQQTRRRVEKNRLFEAIRLKLSRAQYCPEQSVATNCRKFKNVRYRITTIKKLKCLTTWRTTKIEKIDLALAKRIHV